MKELEYFSSKPQEIRAAPIARPIQFNRNGPLDSPRALRHDQNPIAHIDRLKKLDLDIGLLRLSGSGANSAVSAFTSLAKAEVPKQIKK